MPIAVNIRHLASRDLHLQGELPVAELDIVQVDEVIQLRQPLKYDLEVERLEDAILAQGRLHLTLNCECVRCLKPFEFQLALEKWAQFLPLAGEEKVSVVNDCVDLTPFIREDILLEFPQHPLCKTDCSGLPKRLIGKVKRPSGTGQAKAQSSAWAALDKLKLKN